MDEMRKKETESRALSIWLGAAALVVATRLFTVADLGYDLTLQFQAAQNLLQGNGLAIYEQAGDEFSRSMGLVTLTHFPCGFSFAAALLIATGAGPGTVVKISGAIATLLGWWGWGRLAGAYFREGVERAWGWRAAAYAIALVCPLLFTPNWPGTDIMLWAALPWVVTWIAKASGETSLRGLRLDAAAGLLCGVCVLMRYASLFLASYAAMLILCQCRTELSRLARRWAAYGAGFFPAVAIQAYVNNVAAEGSVPHGMTLKDGPQAALMRASDGLEQLSTAAIALVFWVPEKVQNFAAQAAGPLWDLSIIAALIALPAIIAWRVRAGADTAACRDVRFAGAGLLVWLPVFLLACQTFGAFDYVAEERYYLPMVPMALFGTFFIAASGGDQRGMPLNLARFGAQAYLSGFLLVSITWVASMLVPGEFGEGKRRMLTMTRQMDLWPTLETNYEFSEARRYVVDYVRENPDTLLLTNMEHWFYAERDVDLARVHRIVPCSWLEKRYLTGPARVLILVHDEGGPPLEFAWNYFSGTAEHCECYERIPNLRLLRRFPEEETKVLEAKLSAGERVILFESENL